MGLPVPFRDLQGMSSTPSPTHVLLGPSPAMTALRAFVRRAGEVDVPVLLLGETGTGKSLAARAIHEQGKRAEGPFLVVNCAGIPEGLFESELFGHERGAFTGAHEMREGLMETASGGTLFLDEVAELPPSQQGKLLTTLEDREVRRVGSRVARRVDVRVVSGTGVELAAAMAKGAFRRDLYHRLGVLRYRIPPLRERPEDALYLAVRMVRRFARRYGRVDAALSQGARELIGDHPWPGNVRQLAHALEAAVILGDQGLISREELWRVVEPGTGERTVPESVAARSRPSPRPGAVPPPR